MADNEEGEGTTSRGNEWEVVSLTASAYAAAPGPEQVDDNGNNTVEGDAAAGTSQALFMSRHFVFPPNEHENLPLEVENSQVQSIPGVEDVKNPEQASEEENNKLGLKAEDDWNTEGLTVPEDDFEGTKMDGLNVTGKEQDIYSAPDLSPFNAVTGSSIYDENPVILPGETEPAKGVEDLEDPFHSPKSSEGDECGEHGLPPCEAWWKRGAASLYAQAKEANAIWSVFIAAAVMGLVIIGQHWQQERWQVLQLKWQLSVNDEKTGRMLGPLARLKDVIVGGNRRGSVLTAGSSTER